MRQPIYSSSEAMKFSVNNIGPPWGDYIRYVLSELLIRCSKSVVPSSGSHCSSDFEVNLTSPLTLVERSLGLKEAGLVLVDWALGLIWLPCESECISAKSCLMSLSLCLFGDILPILLSSSSNEHKSCNSTLNNCTTVINIFNIHKQDLQYHLIILNIIEQYVSDEKI